MMFKKKILFVIPEYSHGGTNKSLENLLHFIDKDRYNVSIFSLYEDGGALYKEIFAPYVLKKSFLYSFAHDNKLTRKIMGGIMKLSSNADFKWLYIKEANRLQSKFHFDTVIAFQEGTATNFVSYINDNVNRIAWIHCDYAARWNNIHQHSETKFYDKFNHIVCVSNAATASMLNIYPQYREVTTNIYNTLVVNEIEEKSGQFEVDFDKNVFNIISVGRFAGVKQFHLIPEIVAEIKKITNKTFCWYILGDGSKKSLTQEKINKLGISSSLKLVGAVDNPYPYIKASDLHVCSSKSESFSYTIAESKILHTPVLCNDFPVAYEVVDDSVGWICNINDMAQKIADIIDDKDAMYTRMKKSIANYEYNNGDIIDRIYSIL